VPRYFELKASGSTISSIREADNIAGHLNEAAAPLGVRIVAVRPSYRGAFIYAYSSRRPQPSNAVVAHLRSQRQFADCGFSDERPSADGPFA
jgi:hypothetical protein